MLLAAFDHASRGGDHGPRFLFPLLLLILGGFLFAKIVRRRRGGGGYGHHGVSPVRTLDDRFARGEIDRAEYEHRKAVLNGEDIIPPAPAAAAPPAPAPAAPPSPPVTDRPATDTVDGDPVDDGPVDDADDD